MTLPTMQQLKTMFDQINIDVGAEGFVPYSDVEFYADQIECIYADDEITDAQALELAQALATL